MAWTYFLNSSACFLATVLTLFGGAAGGDEGVRKLDQRPLHLLRNLGGPHRRRPVGFGDPCGLLALCGDLRNRDVRRVADTLGQGDGRLGHREQVHAFPQSKSKPERVPPERGEAVAWMV